MGVKDFIKNGSCDFVYPLLFKNGFTNLASLLDNIMIGQLGTLSMSGVSITNQLLQVFNVTIFEQCQAQEFMVQFWMENKEGVRIVLGSN